MRSLLLPKNFLSLSLLILLFSSIPQFGIIVPLKNLLLGVGTAVLTDLLLLKVRGVPLFFPSAAIVSGLIIALLLSPQAPLYVIAAAALLAIINKQFLRFCGHHIFNPAAFGLLLSAVIFRQPVSWWGVSWGIIPTILIIVLVGHLVLYRMHRYLIPLFFLATYFVVLKFSTINFQLSTILDPTLLFFSLVMLPEPMTSPNDHKRQVFYGIFVAILTLVLSLTTLNSIDPLILSLLLGNLLFRLI